MKHLLFLLPVLLVSLTTIRAQDRVAIPIGEAEAYGLDISVLDAAYGPAAHVDPSQSVFPDRQEEVHEAWRTLLSEFSGRLKEEGFEWDEPLRAFYRFYFEPDGTIDKVLYDVQGLEGERAEEYGRILDAFARSHTFGLSADRGFAQCSPATLRPPVE